jgi:LacI family transcriptional regulator
MEGLADEHLAIKIVNFWKSYPFRRFSGIIVAMCARQRKIKRVLVALWMGTSGRDILSGIFRHVQARARWDITLVQLPNGFRPAIVEDALRTGIDGIIAGDFSSPQIRQIVETTDVPCVSIGAATSMTRPCGGAVSFVGCDDRAIGAMAARHFLSLGTFNGFGFVHADGGKGTRDMRETGFSDTLAQTGKISSVFTSPRRPDEQMDTRKIMDWLRSLPKPAAILCYYDPLAVQILNICRDCGISVPRQVSVLGVDNDPLLCDFSTPPLSSVMPDHERAGLLAARELDRMFTRPNRSPHVVVCPPIKIVERESTRPLTPAAHLIRKAHAFIDGHVASGISVKDVVSHLKVSRRLADLRFREIENCTIRDAIEAQRMSLAEKALVDTSQTIRRIAADCGYASANTFEIAFRKLHGLSPGEYRRRSTGGS